MIGLELTTLGARKAELKDMNLKSHFPNASKSFFDLNPFFGIVKNTQTSHINIEAMSKAQIKNERQLQSMIVNLLRLKGIEPLWHRTDKRSAATVGWPDISFAVAVQREWE